MAGPTPELTCCVCGSPMARVAKSLPQGEATCHSCRRARRPPVQPLEIRRCAKCGQAFQPRTPSQRYCRPGHRPGGGASGSSTQRGYGAKHQAERKRLAPTVDAGHAYCAELVCLEPHRWIQPGTPWDLAHDRTNGGYLGPAHRKCNRAEGARFKLGRVETPTPMRREIL